MTTEAKGLGSSQAVDPAAAHNDMPLKFVTPTVCQTLNCTLL